MPNRLIFNQMHAIKYVSLSMDASEIVSNEFNKIN